jgi:hypothetical protein
MLHCNIGAKPYLPRVIRTGIDMSKQLAVASAFSVFAMSALALFAPGAARVPGSLDQRSASEIAAPIAAGAFSSPLALLD